MKNINFDLFIPILLLSITRSSPHIDRPYEQERTLHESHDTRPATTLGILTQRQYPTAHRRTAIYHQTPMLPQIFPRRMGVFLPADDIDNNPDNYCCIFHNAIPVEPRKLIMEEHIGKRICQAFRMLDIDQFQAQIIVIANQKNTKNKLEQNIAWMIHQLINLSSQYYPEEFSDLSDRKLRIADEIILTAKNCFESEYDELMTDMEIDVFNIINQVSDTVLHKNMCIFTLDVLLQIFEYEKELELKKLIETTVQAKQISQITSRKPNRIPRGSMKSSMLRLSHLSNRFSLHARDYSYTI